MMTKFFVLIISLIGFNLAFAENVKIKTPAISGKLTAKNIEMTDWQTSLACYFNYQGQRKPSIRYPQTFLIKSETQSSALTNVYHFKVKAGSLRDGLPGFELLTCAYKLILIGKSTLTHQSSFGEIYLYGKEFGTMSESELQIMQDQTQLAKILNEKTKNLILTLGKDGGIVEDI